MPEAITKGFRNADDELSNVFSKVVAQVLGISQTTIGKHKEIFLPLPGPRGHYDLLDAVQKYLRWKTAADGSKEGAVTDARGKLYEAQRRKLELQNQETARNLIGYSDASELHTALVNAIRAGLKALPGRLANQVAGMSRPAECRALINAEVESLLSAYQEVFTELFAEQDTKAGSANGAVDPKADAKPDARPMGRRKPRAPNRKRRAGTVAK